MALRDRLGAIFDDALFAPLFPARGQPAAAPWRLAVVTILQFAERLSDLSRVLLMEYRAAMLEKKLSASTVNVRRSAIRKLVGEAQLNGILDAEQAAKMMDVPNLRQQGTRLGNWLTRDQAKELLAVPDRSKIKGKRDYCILALLVGCALRRKSCPH
jgi:site-specific recombinase XerD